MRVGSRLTIVLAVAALVAVPGAQSSTPRRILRVAFAGAFTSVDPAVSNNSYLAQVEYETCAKLVNFADAAGARGTRLVPEVARALPAVSPDGRTYTFAIRPGFRFADGRAVSARSFAAAINRILRPRVKSVAWSYFEDIIGADDVLTGRADAARGIRVRDGRLEIRLAHRAYDFPERLATQYVCAVPEDYSPFARATGPPPGSGPYTIAEFDPTRMLVLVWNPYYRGARPRRWDEIEWSQRTPGDAVQLQVERGDAEVGYTAPAATRELVAKYGVNRRRFFVAPSLRTARLVLNTQRPLFRNNARLRRAVNFAIDRHALVAEFGGIAGRRTDQYLSHAMPGFRDVQIYPLKRPNLRKARALAHGHTRDGKAILYAANPSSTAQARAEIVRYDLAQIGIDVDIRVADPLSTTLFDRDAPYDLWDAPIDGVDYPDPATVLNRQFSGRVLAAHNNTNLSFFDDPRWTKRLEAAARLPAPRRYDVYGRLDAQLAREAAPAAGYATANWYAFVARRIGCVTLTPVYGTDLGALCVR
jgi:peptide/nickel transport system substrate-binding protein